MTFLSTPVALIGELIEELDPVLTGGLLCGFCCVLVTPKF